MRIPGRKGKTAISLKQRNTLNDYALYLLLIPGIAVTFVFKYIPMYGILIAFQDFNIFEGMLKSPWVGLKHFITLFSSDGFTRILVNTLLISIFKIIFLFPLPIIISLFLNEISKNFFKRSIQTVIYLPHFLSWVVVCSLFVSFLSPSGSFMNMLLGSQNADSLVLMTDKRFFRSILVASEGWKETGWGTIIYLAAISGVSLEQYESAIIDGAGRFKRMWYITLPSIVPTIVLLLTLRMGSVLEAGTEQILLLYSPAVYDVGDVIGTFVYRMGLGKMEYSFSTAVGLFNSVIGFILLVTANKASKKISGMTMW